MTNEAWKSVSPEFGNYDVSSLGRIRRTKSGRIRKAFYDNGIGYQRTVLSVGGKVVTVYVHRLVAMAFCDGDQSLEVNHKDGDKRNNAPENLEWVSRSRNMKHAFVTGLACYRRKAA